LHLGGPQRRINDLEAGRVSEQEATALCTQALASSRRTSATVGLGGRLFANLPALQGQGRHLLPAEKAGALIKTHHGIERIIRLRLHQRLRSPGAMNGALLCPRHHAFLRRGFRSFFFKRFLPACGRGCPHSRVPPLSPPAVAGAAVHSPEGLRCRPAPSSWLAVSHAS
jgi:hypothetical protein